jgi:hypothetical protein
MPTPTSPYRFTWRAEFSNQALNLLHAEAFDHAVLDYGWLAQVRGHSLGWVCAFDADRSVGYRQAPPPHGGIVGVGRAPHHRQRQPTGLTGHMQLGAGLAPIDGIGASQIPL